MSRSFQPKGVVIVMLFGDTIIIGSRQVYVPRKLYKRLSNLYQSLWRKHLADVSFCQGGVAYRLYGRSARNG